MSIQDTPDALALMPLLAERSEALCAAVQRGDVLDTQEAQEACEALRAKLAAAPSLRPDELEAHQLAALKEAVTRVKRAEATLAQWREKTRPVEEQPAARDPIGAEVGVVELVEASSPHDFAAFLPGPTVLTNSAGLPLVGYDGKNLARAALHLVAHGAHGRYGEALATLDELQRSLEVERMGLEFLELVLPTPLWERDGETRTDGATSSPIERLLLNLYACFTGEDVATIEGLLADASERGETLWRQVVPDEERPTYEQLSAYYNGLTFPQGDMMPEVVGSRLACAYRLIPVLLARHVGAKRAFDYGGGVGLCTSALAAAGVEQVTLIEESHTMLEFAAWRDGRAQIEGVTYLRESALCDRLEEHAGAFDVGVCIEVLEHVLDVKGTMARMAKLLRPGGLLFQSASFALYPHLSHLKPNVAYAGHEDELMAEAGFDRVPFDLPIPTLANQRVYRRR